MTRDEIFDVWAPTDGAWSPWCKPVLFAHMDAEDVPALPEPITETFSMDFQGMPARDERVAVVVDLPGRLSVAVGLMLAERVGYRPVPLFNAAPPPFRDQPARIDANSILAALFHGTDALRKTRIEPEAPPIFLLDSHRRVGSGGLPSEAFDNRWVSFPTDFPSANRLIASGVQRALLIHGTGGSVEPDLAHTLRRWQEAGISLWEKALDSATPARPLDVPKPSSFKSAWYRMLEMIGLQRHVLGGFGGFPPQPGAGGFGAGG